MNPDFPVVVLGMKREPNTVYVVSYGGGVNSTAMVVFLVENGLPIDYVVFSDTGNEMPETYAYLNIMRKYLERHGIPFVVVRVRNKTGPVGQVHEKKGDPVPAVEMVHAGHEGKANPCLLPDAACTRLPVHGDRLR